MMHRLNVLYRHYQLLGALGIIEFLSKKFLTRGGVIRTKFRMLRFPVELRVNSSDLWTAQQIFLSKEYNFNLDRQPRVLLDVGANIGLAAVFFADRYPDCKIISIEPEAGNYAQARINAAPYPNVIVVQGALWGEDGEVQVTDPGLHEWGFQTKASTSEKASVVRAMTVDTLMREYNLDQIDVLKIDIEGAEVEVFADPSAWIRRIGLLIVELHDGERQGCSRAFYNSTNGFDEEWRRGENVYLVNRHILGASPQSR